MWFTYNYAANRGIEGGDVEQTHMRLRIPNHLKDWLKKSAERNIRSQNAEVIFLLEWAREKISAETEAWEQECLTRKQNEE